MRRAPLGCSVTVAAVIALCWWALATRPAAAAPQALQLVPSSATAIRILYAPAEVDNPAFRSAVASLTGGTVDYFDARAGTPSAVLLATYICVYTWPNAAYSDRVLFGNRLADFADAGGRVVLGTFCTFTIGNSLGGRIMTAGYSPVISPAGSGDFSFSDYVHDGGACMYAGIPNFGFFNRDYLAVFGGGVSDGHYQDGEIASAYRPDFHVIYVNGVLVGVLPTGCLDEWPKLIANAARCSGANPPPQPAAAWCPTCSGEGASTPARDFLSDSPSRGPLNTDRHPSALASSNLLRQADGKAESRVTPRAFAASRNVLTPKSASSGPRILYAPAEVDNPDFRAAVAALTGGTVDYFDARQCIPLPELLATYDCVYTWPDYSYFDPTLFGDRLADFVDAGGRTVLGAFCTFASGNSMRGRIMTSAYSPVTSPAGNGHFSISDYAHDGGPCMYAGIPNFGFFNRDFLALQGAGVQDGHYQDAEIMLAYRPDFRVVYVNGLLVGAPLSVCLDQWPRLIANAARCNGATPLPQPATSWCAACSAKSGATGAEDLPLSAAPAGLANADRFIPEIASMNQPSQGGAQAARGRIARESHLSRNVLTAKSTTSGPHILYAPAEVDDPDFRADLGIFAGGSVDYFDARQCAPLPELLATYDCVYTWPDYPYQDPTLMGDRLADYVDAGGKVILGTFSTFRLGNSLRGRIMASGYSPVTSPLGNGHFFTSDYNHDGTTSIYSGIVNFGSFYRDVLVPQGAGAVDGSFQDAEIATAYRPDFRVMYVNSVLVGNPSASNLDQWPRLIANACLATHAGPPPPASRPALYGCSADGQLFTVDVATGHGSFVGNLPAFATGNGVTEIEFDRNHNVAWQQTRETKFFDKKFDINTGAQLDFAHPDGFAFTGLEFVGSTLFGTTVSSALQPAAGKRILYAPTDVDDPVFRAAVSALTGAAVDYMDTRLSTPTPEFLGGYGCVYTVVDGAYSDRNLFGDRLADFVDAGGRAILGVFCTFTAGNSLGGRIMQPGYSPVFSPTGTNHFAFSSYANDGTSCLHGGVASYGSYYRDVLAPQGSGIVDGHYLDGEIGHAYRPDFAVVYSNGAGAAPLAGTGDWPRLIANAATCSLAPLQSTLRQLDPETGLSTAVGATGVGPIVGLAYDATGSTLYGITGSENRNSRLVSVNLLTGAATPIGATGFDAASLEFGPDGNLYAGGSVFDGGYLYRIDKTNGNSQVIGLTGFVYVTGLTLAEATVGVPPANSERPTLSLAGFRPNPASSELAVSFSLPNNAPATLELLDVRGRRIARREVGDLGAGTHMLMLGSGLHVAPGIYWVRLTQAGRSESKKACVVK